MGGGSTYSTNSRSLRAEEKGFAKAFTNTDQVFEQNTKKQVHESMRPKGITLREARDSEAHPHDVPIILGLDVTGSMNHVPKHLIVDGLPKLMSRLLEKGIDASLLFLAIGDHISDRGPIQVSQFERSDAELDMWLQRVWLEANGGGNGGESYMLAWYVAAYLTKTDAWEKRHQKGFLFTVGDEPVHHSLSKSAVIELFGSNVGEKDNYTAPDLIKAAQEKWEVFHINVEDTSYGDRSVAGWKKLLGEYVISIPFGADVPTTVAEKISSFNIIGKAKESLLPTEVDKPETPTGEEDTQYPSSTIPQML